MTLTFRLAEREDVPAIVALLADDRLGAGRETGDLAPYFAAFEKMERERDNLTIVGLDAGGRVVATYQITFITGLSLQAARRAQIEAVRVARHLRGQGIGRALLEDAEMRARRAGCGLMQLTSNKARDQAIGFYEGLGFVPTHVGFKKTLRG
jgi:GNAT superfamily N-acetyltransferase